MKSDDQAKALADLGKILRDEVESKLEQIKSGLMEYDGGSTVAKQSWYNLKREEMFIEMLDEEPFKQKMRGVINEAIQRMSTEGVKITQDQKNSFLNKIDFLEDMATDCNFTGMLPSLSVQKSKVEKLEAVQPGIEEWVQRQKQQQIDVEVKLGAAADSLKMGGKEHKEAREEAKKDLRRLLADCSDVTVLEKIQDDIKSRMKEQGLYAKVKRFRKKHTQTGALETQYQDRIDFLKARQQQGSNKRRAMNNQEKDPQRGPGGRMT